MRESVQIYRLNHTDLNMYQCGMQDCNPGHAFGPSVRDHFLIHYITRGKGIFQLENKTYSLRKGQGFLICPGVITFYQADNNDPWTYSWVGFHGLRAESYLQHANLSLDNPVFSYDKDSFIKDCFDQMIATKKLKKGREIRLLGLLYMFLSQLVEVNGRERFFADYSDKKELYVKKVIEYIEMNYSRKICITDISRYIGLDRSYLGSIFKEHLNSSLQNFLINYRVNKAIELMRNNTLTIGDISRSVGYDDPLLFSKVFKKVSGQSPREFRKNYE